MPRPRNTLAHIYAGFDKSGGPDACWPWSRGKDKDGYGKSRFDGGPIRTHRFAYEQKMGEIPPGMDVLHHCDNPPCGNPDHLFIGTSADNVTDRDIKGRQAKGSKIGLSKLSASKVRKIRHAYANYASSSALAEQYGVYVSVIEKIVSGKLWKHISGLDECLARPKRYDGKPKLTEDDIRNIRGLLRIGLKQRGIAAMFGVSQVLISRIKCGKSGSHVPDEEPN